MKFKLEVMVELDADDEQAVRDMLMERWMKKAEAKP